MKNLIKYCAVIFALLLAGAIITGCVNAGVALVQAIADKSGGEIKINGDVILDLDELEEEGIFQPVEGGIRMFGIQFGGTVETKSGTYNVEGAIREIEVDGVNGEVEIVRGDAFRVTYENIPVEYLIKEENGKLILKDESRRVFAIHFGMSDAKICLTVPAEVQLSKVTADNGSGKLSVSDLVTESLRIDGGSGNMSAQNIITDKLVVDGGSGGVKLTNVTAKQSRMDMGSGALSVAYSVLGDTRVDSGSGSCNFETVQANNLTVDSGSGRIVYQGELTGNCIFESGSGSVRLDIDGNKENYNIRASLGSGGFYVNGKKESSGIYAYNNGSAEHTLVFNTGSGRVSVNFSE